ncbi:MAG: hypothetical protein HY644_00100 [Acidobacteria bacterium]|nr:hypothetical protein [Acidobacteriota bacterium]
MNILETNRLITGPGTSNKNFLSCCAGMELNTTNDISGFDLKCRVFGARYFENPEVHALTGAATE